jgi:hypothetical protein
MMRVERRWKGHRRPTQEDIMTKRTRTYLASLETDDPLTVANRMIDEATELQNAGRWQDAERLLSRAEELLVGEPS